MHRLAKSDLTSLLPVGGTVLSGYSQPIPALFLDRDGVINVDTCYLHRREDCVFVDGIFDLARAFASTHALIVITNQAGIGRGYYSEEKFACFMNWMQDRFVTEGAPLTAIYYCPDHPEGGVGPYRRENQWRKPGPGMFLQAARDFPLDMARSWCIGDTPGDMAAARSAGVGHRVLLSQEHLDAADGDGWRRVTSLDAARRLFPMPAAQ